MTGAATASDAWLHPTVQAALVAALVALAGWWFNARQNRRRDVLLRAERVEDVQRALLAEVRANFGTMSAGQMEEVRLAGLRQIERGVRPLLPAYANDRVFQAIIGDIPILPSAVIDPVVLYYRQLAVVGALTTDFRALAMEDVRRAASIFSDYVELHIESVAMAGNAIEALRVSLEEGEAGLARLADEQQAAETARIRAELPGELDDLRAGLNTRSSGRSVP